MFFNLITSQLYRFHIKLKKKKGYLILSIPIQQFLFQLFSISYGLCEYLHYVLPNSIIRVYSIDVPLDLGNIVFPNEVYHNIMFMMHYLQMSIVVLMVYL